MGNIHSSICMLGCVDGVYLRQHRAEGPTGKASSPQGTHTPYRQFRDSSEPTCMSLDCRRKSVDTLSYTEKTGFEPVGVRQQRFLMNWPGSQL